MTNVPVFNPDMYNFSVAENAAIGTIVGQVQATDLDNQTLSYWLGEDSFRSHFDVDASTGEIIVERELDYEWQSSETLTIEATDPDWNSAFASVSITITNFNEHPAFGQSLYSFSLAENAATGAIVGTVSATDPQSDPLTYSIGVADEGYGLIGAAFEIDSLTGEISFQGSLDYESASSIGLKVYAFDEGVNIAEADVQIAFLDAAYDPVFDLASYAFSIDENEPADTSLGTVLATDPLGLGIAYSLEDGYDNQAFAIDPATGNITAKVPLNYEYGSAYNLTAFATNANGVTTAVAVTVTVNNIDETPNPNNAPVLSGLTFTMTEQKDGFANGEIEGVITDDYVAEGYYTIKIDIYHDGEIDFEYEAPQGLSALWFETAIAYGTHDIAVRIDEYELESGSTLVGSWVVISAVATAPANSAPTVSNLSYSTIEEGYGPDNLHHYLMGDIIDGTRGYSTYSLQFDMDGNGTVDDYTSVENDWETFALRFFPNVGNHNVAVRVVERDLNTGADLTGAWASLGFTVPPYEPPNHAPVMKFVDFIESGYGYGGIQGYLVGEFNDDFADPDYKLEVDTDGDGVFNHQYNIGASESFNQYLTLQQGETIEATRVRIFDVGPGLVSDWVAVNYVNQPPVITPPQDSIKISLPSLDDGTTTNGHVVETLSATDPDNPNGLIDFVLVQPSEIAITMADGKKVTQKLPRKALDIDDQTGKITIVNPDVLAKFLREYGKYEFTVYAFDRPNNENAAHSFLNLTVYDDWEVYHDRASRYIASWQTVSLNYVTQTFQNVQLAADQLKDFINGKYNTMGFGVDIVGNGTWAAAAFLSTPQNAGMVSIAAVAAQCLAKAQLKVGESGADAVAKEALRFMRVEVRDKDTKKINKNAKAEIKTLDELEAKTSNDPLDQRALLMRDFNDDVRDRLISTFKDGEALSPPDVDDIYGELLLHFAAGRKWDLVYYSFYTGDKKWYAPNFKIALGGIDVLDVRDELNRIGYDPPYPATQVKNGLIIRNPQWP